MLRLEERGLPCWGRQMADSADFITPSKVTAESYRISSVRDQQAITSASACRCYFGDYLLIRLVPLHLQRFISTFALKLQPSRALYQCSAGLLVVLFLGGYSFFLIIVRGLFVVLFIVLILILVVIVLVVIRSLLGPVGHRSKESHNQPANLVPQSRLERTYFLAGAGLSLFLAEGLGSSARFRLPPVDFDFEADFDLDLVVSSSSSSSSSASSSSSSSSSSS